MKVYIFLLLFFYSINIFSFELLSGDILFQDGSSDFNNAVKKVTNSVEGYNFSHCGIYFVDSTGNEFVIEAFNDGVILTDISEFMNRHLTKDNKPKVVVGRLVDSLTVNIPDIIQNALIYLGKKYDNEFDLENDEIYCSELIYFVYKNSFYENIFETNPMTFIDVNTNQIHQYWQKHFGFLEIPVPEGKEGINPGGISKSNSIKIVHYYF